MRTTDKCLNSLAERLNRLTNQPLEPWTRDESGVSSAVGNFHISRANGGVALHQMGNTSGGVTDVFFSGHVPKRELERMIRAFITGIEYQQGQRNDLT